VSTVTLGRQQVPVAATGHGQRQATTEQTDNGGGDVTDNADANNPNGTTGGNAPGTTGGGSNGSGTTGGGGNAKGLQCSLGRNGGGTDTGVSGNEIKLAATVVKSGVGSAFLGDVEYGMIAQKNKINSSGGICGRQLSLKLVDDGWIADTGEQYIQNFINEGYFALAVVPSSEGLRKAIDAGDIDRAGMPVVGSDGMLIDQYTDPWVWPVATSTNSLMHIIAKNAYDRGARSFGIVYDSNYRFGVEGEAAFKGAVQRLGGNLQADVGIVGGQTNYQSDINNRFNSQCGPQSGHPCDFVALLLEPETATYWIKQGGYLGDAGKALGAGGPQTLFSDGFAKDFAANCPQPCKTHFWVWTGFKPPVAPFDTDPAVTTYVNDMNATNSQADNVNQFVEGGYDGFELLVNAMKQVGPDLTRGALRQVLDAMKYESGLSVPRVFSSGKHFANVDAQAFSIVINGQSFANWRYEQTGFIPDPWVGQDIAQ
jgi:ABC-type branched-subunit amino acid transport system substrate-binding protein